MAIARLGHLSGLLFLFWYTCAKRELIYCPFRYSKWQYAPFRWLLLDLLLVSQTGYKQVSKQLAKSLSNAENPDNLTALYTSYLYFAFGTNSMHIPLVLTGFLFSYWLSSTNLCCMRCGSKMPLGLSIMCRFLRLRHTHAGVI